MPATWRHTPWHRCTCTVRAGRDMAAFSGWDGRCPPRSSGRRSRAGLTACEQGVLAPPTLPHGPALAARGGGAVGRARQAMLVAVLVALDGGLCSVFRPV